jgi:uncharacterized cupin superfamily protein
MPLTIFKNAQRTNLPSMSVPDTAAFLADVHISNDSEKPITCGFFRMEHGKALVYDYSYEEMKIIVEGEMIITDENGQRAHVFPGDVLYFAKGSRIQFESPSYGIGFFCGQRKWGEA